MPAWLQHWNVSHLVGDNTGIGAGQVNWLSARFPADRLTNYNFTRQSKVKLGSNFITVVETGRFRYWSDEDNPLSDDWWFFRHAGVCTYSLPSSAIFGRHLQLGIIDSAKISTSSIRIHTVRAAGRFWFKAHLNDGPKVGTNYSASMMCAAIWKKLGFRPDSRFADTEQFAIIFFVSLATV